MATNITTLVNDNNATIYSDVDQPVGSDFKDPILVAAIAVNGACAISFAVLGIMTWRIQGKAEKGRRIFAALSPASNRVARLGNIFWKANMEGRQAFIFSRQATKSHLSSHQIRPLST
jgi:hypothetical protein